MLLLHSRSLEAWTLYHGLPEKIRELADTSYALLQDDPFHPSLHFMKIGKYRTVPVGLHYRAPAVETADGMLWFWIGSHAEYDKLLG